MHVKGYSPPTSSSNSSSSSSKNRHVVLVIVLVALHQTILSPEAQIRRCHSRSTTCPTFFPRLSRGPSLPLSCEYSAKTFAREVARLAETLFRESTTEGNCTRAMRNGPVEWMARVKQTVKLRGRSLAVDWRASAYPTPLITGRHPLRPTARPPLRRIAERAPNPRGHPPPRANSRFTANRDRARRFAER